MDKELLEELGKQFGMIVDWSNSNVMPYLQDLSTRVVRYEFITSLCWTIVGAIVAIAGIVLIFRGLKKAAAKANCYSSDGEFEIIVGALMALVSVMLIIFQINDIILCAYLPEKSSSCLLKCGGVNFI